VACLPAAYLVAHVGLYGSLFWNSSGCEDYGIACHDARPALAISFAATAAVAVVSLLSLAAALLASSGRRWRIRSAALAGASIAFGLLLVYVVA